MPSSADKTTQPQSHNEAGWVGRATPFALTEGHKLPPRPLLVSAKGGFEEKQRRKTLKRSFSN